MLRSTFLRYAASSALAATARAGRRPRYGGVLRLASGRESDLLARNGRLAWAIHSLVFEALLRFGEADRLEPVLATDWRLAYGPRREWAFTLRPGIRFHDGSLCTKSAVAASLDGEGLRSQSGSGSEVVAASTTPVPLFRELAEARRVVRRDSDSPIATGSFRIVRENAQAPAALVAFEDHWAGRPFLNEISLRPGVEDPALSVELGNADLARIEASEAPRAAQRGIRLWRSKPSELLLLQVDAAHQKLAQALDLAVDRDAIHRAMLQGEGAPAAALLPDWMTGYGFLFPARRDLAAARGLAAGFPSIHLQFDSTDRLLNTVSSRLSLDLRPLGIAIAPREAGTKATIRLRRIRLRSVQPAHALRGLAEDLGIPLDAYLRNAQGVFDAERQLISRGGLIALAHIPDIYAVSNRVRSITARPVDSLGRLRLDAAWLDEANR